MEKSNKDLQATIIATGEVVTVYQLQNGNYHDSNCIGADVPPTTRSGKKIFTKNELRF